LQKPSILTFSFSLRSQIDQERIKTTPKKKKRGAKLPHLFSFSPTICCTLALLVSLTADAQPASPPLANHATNTPAASPLLRNHHLTSHLPCFCYCGCCSTVAPAVKVVPATATAVSANRCHCHHHFCPPLTDQ